MAQVGRTVRRRWLIITIAVIVLLGIVLSALSGFYVDLLWFREVHFSGVFWTVFWAKIVLGLIFGVLFFLLLAGNLFVVRRLTPRVRAFSPETEVIDRYRAAFDPYLRWLIPAFAAVIALFVGIAASAQWQTFVVWRAAGSVAFHQADPIFHRDPAFYIFILPFHKFVQGWLFSALVGVTVITIVAHYLFGGIRPQAVGEKVTAQVKAHVSVLLGLIVLTKAWGYRLGQFDLLTSPRGVVTGASYTDVHAQKPALQVLVLIAIACAVLFLVNIRFRGWALPALGIGLLLLTSVVIGALVPAFVQRFQVKPQEFQKEEPYIARNIAATRYAFGLDKIKLTAQPSVAQDLTSDQVSANQATIQNIRLWSPSVLLQTYQQLQRIQPYYEFSDVDVDRYTIQGQERVVMISPREIAQSGIPGGGGTWQNQHLFYTHGYGTVASPVNTVTVDGAPVYVLQDIPPVSSGIPLSAQGDEIYYQERADVPYLVVNSSQNELNYPLPNGGTATTKYAGKGGIQLGGFLRRALFAYRYKDFNLMISGLINGNSKILINRSIATRVQKAAPFLRYDRDPYAAIVNGRLVYVYDAYTSTDAYPYSERINTGQPTNGGLQIRTNYIRNSVKAVVDAYDGTVTFYVVDPSDPLIQVWEKAFPHLFTTSPAPAALRAHFRYPENLLQIQASQFANYHVTTPQVFYSKQNFWALPSALSSAAGAGATQGVLAPYYVVTKLPDQSDEQFMLFMPLTPINRQNMVAYLAGMSDPQDYGQLEAFQLPGGQPVNGPQQARALINQDPSVSSQITLLSQKGSDVLYGDLLTIPIEQGFLYVQPIFVTSTQGNAIPQLKRVVVVHGDTVAIDTNLTAALAASFGQSAPPPSGGGGQPPPTGGTVQDLLAQALSHFQKAQDALKAGDLATYQAEINLAERLVQQANQLAGSPSASPTPTPTASP